MNELENVVSGEQVRPWVRYWARTIDILVFLILFMIVMIFLAVNVDGVVELIDEIPETAFGVVIGFLYIFVEPILLSTWGTTIGKSLLKVRVRDRYGKKLSYSEGLKRTFSVWFFGQGMGLPLISLITHIVAYNKLSDNGITSWDESGDYIVSHQTIGTFRATLITVMFILFVVLYVAFLTSIAE